MMTLRDALERIVPRLGDEVRVHANGFLSRAAFGARDTDTCFYMIGSMGLAVVDRPRGRAGTSRSTRHRVRRRRQRADEPGRARHDRDRAPSNLLHVCFDNSAHASTGGQPTISDRVALEEMARAAGYRWTARVESASALDAVLPGFLERDGPAFLLVRIALGPAGPPGPRIPWTPPEMTARLRRVLGA